VSAQIDHLGRGAQPRGDFRRVVGRAQRLDRGASGLGSRHRGDQPDYLVELQRPQVSLAHHYIVRRISFRRLRGPPSRQANI
jgi:hypothetical protein